MFESVFLSYPLSKPKIYYLSVTKLSKVLNTLTRQSPDMFRNIRKKLNQTVGRIPYLGDILTAEVKPMYLAAGLLAAAACYSPQGQTPDFIHSNDKIQIECYGCREVDKPILEESFRLQTQAYDCLADLLDHSPSECGYPQVIYKFYHLPESIEYGDNAGTVRGTVVTSRGFIGIIENSTAVNSVEDVRMDKHETMHAFTHSGYQTETLKPLWLNEGFSIIVEDARLDCGDKQTTPMRFDPQSFEDWERLKDGLDPQYGNTLESPHIKGSIFFAALYSDYDCSLDCAVDIWNELRKGYGAEQSDSRILSNSEIKEVAEKITGHDLESVFDLIGEGE